MEQDFVSAEASRYTVQTLVADSCSFQLFPYRIVQGTPITVSYTHLGIPYMNSLMLCLLTETIIRLLQGTYASPMAPASSTAHQSAMDELFDRIIALF